jgi:hypothetical protein
MNGGEECEPLRGYRYYRRTFINRPGYHATAFVFATVSCAGADDEYGPHCELVIADCSRSISLSIDTGNEESRANTLYKLDTLITTLTEFRAAYIAECEAVRSRERRKNPVQVLTTWLG